MENEFTATIIEVLTSHFGDAAQDIFATSPLLQYCNIKMRSASRGSKSRGSFANIYAVFVLVEDYLNKGFNRSGNYSKYEGARFSDLFIRQRELPFGSKLQNHGLNHRMNEEFRKYFPQVTEIPIIRNVTNNRYWINENLVKVYVRGETFNIAQAITDIIRSYVDTKRSAFEQFIETCERLKSIIREDDTEIISFISGLIGPTADARIFEIVSYAILKSYYHDLVVYFGYEPESVEEEPLALYKTGRTNANDGGIDFVMRPVGRFFQVTETLDVKKYFLDIDKIERFPISFVIKSTDDVENIKEHLLEGARRQYSIQEVVDRYMNCIEEIINIPILLDRFAEAVGQGNLRDVLDEIITQSKVEFNYEDAEGEV